jgi:hypothetical protein
MVSLSREREMPSWTAALAKLLRSAAATKACISAKTHLFLIDHAHKRRVKILDEARIIEGDVGLIARLMPEGYQVRPGQVVLFTISAWDTNCPQRILRRFEAADVDAAFSEREAKEARRSLRRSVRVDRRAVNHRIPCWVVERPHGALPGPTASR